MMKKNQFHITPTSNRTVWKFVSLTLFITLLLTTFFAQAGSVFGKNHDRTAEAAPRQGTIVLFPNNQHARILQRSETEINTTVPNGVEDGDVLVSSRTGISNGISFQLGSSFIPSEVGEAASWDSTFSGTVNSDTTWDTNLLLTGDVTVPAGVTLTISSGTTIFVATDSDDQNSGKWNDKTELLIFGELLVTGTESAPVYFTSDAINKSPANWGGIQIREGSTTSELSNCMIRYAIDGIKLTSQNAPGGGDVWARIQNCSIQNNEVGIKFWANTHWPDGTDIQVGAEIKNNLIANNVEEGIYLWNWLGYKSSITDPLIVNNVIENNNLGIYLRTVSWWLGHADDRTTIKNNTINNNATYGVFIETLGSSDGSGSDTDAQPVIENNLLYENQTNILLKLDPQGSDGLQNFQPVIRYNTISDAQFGIIISDTQPYDTFIPTIDHNVFMGFDNSSSFAIANQTNRTVNVDNNYWGETATEWNAGMPANSISGTVYSSNPLNSMSPPIITKFASEVGQIGDSVTIYGANFGVKPSCHSCQSRD